MTSILEVEQLDTLSSNASSTLTIGGTNTTTIAFGPNVTTTPSSLANTPAFHIQNTSNQSINNTTMTKVTFNSELFDTDNCFASSTFTPTVAGKYFLYSQINMDINTGTGQIQVRVYKNGGLFERARQAHFYGNNQQTYSVSSIVEANGTTDYFEIYTYQDSGSSRTLTGDADSVYFMGYRITGA